MTIQLLGRQAGIAVLLISAACMGACSTTAGIEAGGRKSWNLEGAPELLKNVVFNNSGLAGDIEVIDIRNSMAGNLMKAQVSLKSKDRDTLPIQYRFDWYDADGMQVGTDTAWKPLLIYGKEIKMIQGVAPDPRTREFKLKIREKDRD